MTMRHIARLAAAGLLALAAVSGCGAPTEEKNTGGDAGVACDPAKYPCGPYGYVPGSVITDIGLIGRRDHNQSGSPTDDPIEKIRFSTYFQEKSTKVLVILVAAEWCNPCRVEQPGLIDLYKSYEGKGVAFNEALIQDKKGAPADIDVADRWANTSWAGKKIPFDISADPTVALGPYYNVAAFPMQMVIRTSDMSIRWQNNGLANEDLKNQIDAVLAE